MLEVSNTLTLIYALHQYDNVHFSDFGMIAYAKLWLQAIVNKSEYASTRKQIKNKGQNN